MFGSNTHMADLDLAQQWQDLLCPLPLGCYCVCLPAQRDKASPLKSVDMCPGVPGSPDPSWQE